MEFKNFENKLIVEKITNYCIENNINAQQINALTAKFKFGKLNERVLLEFLNKAIDMIGGTGGFTSTQKYNSAKKIIQNKLQTAITSVDSVVNDLSGTDNIFKKYSITLDDTLKQNLINAVKEFQNTLNGDVVKNVKTSLEKIGGNVSGSSNFGDESSTINFELAFPELTKGGALDTAFSKAFPASPTEMEKIKPQIKSNINASTKGKDPLQVSPLLKRFKDSLAIAIKQLNTTAAVAPGASATDKAIKAAAAKHQSGYRVLVALVDGRFADNNTPTTATPATPATPNPARVQASLANSDDFTPEIAAGFKTSAELKKLIKDAFKEGKKYKELEEEFLDLTNDLRFKNFILGTGTAVATADVPRKIITFVGSLRSIMGL